MAVLYTGTDATHFQTDKPLIHCPLIKPVPRSFDDREIQVVFEDVLKYTHIIFTSKNTIPVFCDFVNCAGFELTQVKSTIIAIGKVTAHGCEEAGLKVDIVAKEEHQEGVIEELQWLDLEDAYFFLPRSSKSRPVIENYLIRRRIRYQVCDIYDTVTNTPDKLPNLDEVDEIVFTSPSTVLAFLQIFSAIPKDKKLTSVGPITAAALTTGVHDGTEN